MTDEFHGVGGSYLLDPKTGKRTRVEESTQAEPAPPYLASPAPPSPLGGEGPGEREILTAPAESTSQQPTDKPRKGVR